MPKKKKSSRSARPSIPSKFARVLVSSSGSVLHGSTPSELVGAAPLTPPACSVDSIPQVEMKRKLPSSPEVLIESSPPLSGSSPLSSNESVEVLGSSIQRPVIVVGTSSSVIPVSEISSTEITSPPPGSLLADAAIPILNPPVKPSSDPSFSNLSSKPVSEPNRLELPWASKFKASLRNLKQMAPPSFLEDGTPVVVAPPSVLLKTAEMWKGHIVAQFHGLLYHWTPEGPLELQELQTAPTWAILKNVPPQLYSLEGISVIASGIGEPLHTEKSWLDPINIGSTKVKVVINLGTPLPATVVVRDIQGNTARVAVEYPRPPPKCLNCGRYGHLLSRCPKPLMKKLPFKKDRPSGDREVSLTSLSLPASTSELVAGSHGKVAGTPSAEIQNKKPKRRRSRSKKRSNSLPPRILDISVVTKEKVTPRLSSADKQKWIAKEDIKSSTAISSSGIIPVLVPPMLPAVAQVPVVRAVENESAAKLLDSSFPIPPGWGAMSNKVRKRLLKIWHNKVRNTAYERTPLWADISRLSSSSPLFNTPWILAGDFNQVASIGEHYSIIPSNMSLRGMEDLQACLRDNDLVDLPSRGVFYTWSNHQQENPIIRKLDRAIVNDEWLSTFPTSTAVFEPPGDSDHAPCIIMINNQPERSKKCFKYFSFLSTHPQFLPRILAAWETEIAVGSCMFSLGELLKAAKKACRDLNREGFSNIQQRTSEAFSALEEIQSRFLTDPSTTLFREEHVARKNWDFFSSALESFFRQKSRIKWLNEGD
ncbi:unnamed protein product, partial [Arabidopsis halleri]